MESPALASLSWPLISVRAEMVWAYSAEALSVASSRGPSSSRSFSAAVRCSIASRSMVMTLWAFLELGEPNGGGNASSGRGDTEGGSCRDLHLGHTYVVGRWGGRSDGLWGDDGGWGGAGR